MILKVELARCIKEVLRADKLAISEYRQLTGRYQLTAEGREQEKRRIFGELKERAEEQRRIGLNAIDNRIREIDEAERGEALKRSNDTGYYERLNSKIEALKKSEIDNMDNAVLKDLFAEFANDPVAISAIQNSFGSMVGFIPENHTGEVQAHLREIKPSFERAIESTILWKFEESEKDPEMDETVKSFLAYLDHQNGDLTRDDITVTLEVFNERYGIKPEQEQDLQNGNFDFNFKGVR